MNSFIWIVFLFSNILSDSGNSYTLNVKIKGFSDDTGKAYVAIYREEDKFPQFGKQYKGNIVSISKSEAVATFSGIEPGKYAVAVYHDRNNNRKLDKNMIGAPVEAYGFSNNVRGIFGSPSFYQASFEVKNNRTINVLVQ